MKKKGDVEEKKKKKEAGKEEDEGGAERLEIKDQKNPTSKVRVSIIEKKNR